MYELECDKISMKTKDLKEVFKKISKICESQDYCHKCPLYIQKHYSCLFNTPFSNYDIDDIILLIEEIEIILRNKEEIKDILRGEKDVL